MRRILELEGMEINVRKIPRSSKGYRVSASKASGPERFFKVEREASVQHTSSSSSERNIHTFRRLSNVNLTFPSTRTRSRAKYTRAGRHGDKSPKQQPAPLEGADIFSLVPQLAWPYSQTHKGTLPLLRSHRLHRKIMVDPSVIKFHKLTVGAHNCV